MKSRLAREASTLLAKAAEKTIVVNFIIADAKVRIGLFVSGRIITRLGDCDTVEEKMLCRRYA